MSKARFLQAEWRNLLMVNYEVDPAILAAYLPPATELDLWEGKALVSMVGFLFKETKVLGVKWPFHVNFEEVNLRFYVRYFDGQEWKRGAVFISEIVPKSLIAITANALYNEHYLALPMRHTIVPAANDCTEFLYEWKLKGRWNKLGAVVSNKAEPIIAGSQEEFIFEHYWGYNKLTDTKTIEYQVEHVSWETRRVESFIFDADVAALYGKEFEAFLNREPVSAFFAGGSAIAVRIGEKISVDQVLPVSPGL